MFKTILVPFAFDPGSQAALAFAQTIVEPGGRIHLVHVVEDVMVGEPYDAFIAMGDVTDAIDDKLTALEREVAGSVRMTHSVVKGSIWRGVLDAAKRAKSE